jgi:hypothetical protein
LAFEKTASDLACEILSTREQATAAGSISRENQETWGYMCHGQNIEYVEVS